MDKIIIGAVIAFIGLVLYSGWYVMFDEPCNQMGDLSIQRIPARCLNQNFLNLVPPQE